jgi:hypothetical protein
MMTFYGRARDHASKEIMDYGFAYRCGLCHTLVSTRGD